MAEETTPPVTPVTPVVDPSAPAVPVKSQDVTPTQTQQAPALEVKQAAETFDALNKLFDEPTGQPKAVAPTVSSEPSVSPTSEKPVSGEPPKTTPVGTDDFQSKLDAAKAPVGAHPNVAAGLDSLKALAQAEHARVEELSTKLKTYEEMAKEYQELKAGNKLPEPVEKELTGLRERFREIDYQGTPEFQKNYVQPVRQAEADIMGMLKQAGMKENIEKFIQENGGIIALSQSDELAGQSDAPDMTMAEWVDRKLLAPTPSVFKNRIIGKLTQAQDAIERGRAEIADFRANSKERWEARMKTMQADFDAGRDEAIAKMGDLAKLREIKSDFTPEQRVEAERHNKLIRDAAAQYDQLVGQNKDPKTAGRLMAQAVQADVLMNLYNESQATIKALQAKIDGLKASGAHSTAGDHSPPIGTEKPSRSELLKKDTGTAMNDLFKATTL